MEAEEEMSVQKIVSEGAYPLPGPDVVHVFGSPTVGQRSTHNSVCVLSMLNGNQSL